MLTLLIKFRLVDVHLDDEFDLLLSAIQKARNFAAGCVSRFTALWIRPFYGH